MCGPSTYADEQSKPARIRVDTEKARAAVRHGLFICKGTKSGVVLHYPQEEQSSDDAALKVVAVVLESVVCPRFVVTVSSIVERPAGGGFVTERHL